MSILAGLQGLSCILIAVFYRKMKKRRSIVHHSITTNGVATTEEDEIELLGIDEQEHEENV